MSFGEQKPEGHTLLGGLDGLVGNHKNAAFLKQGLERGKLAHAYLFVGPTGVGKKTAAMALCQAFNCLERPLVGCGECPVCSRIARGLHPDFVVVSPEKRWILVKQIRELEARTELGPYEGKALVVVLAPADAMNLAAANALLKTLEEPRPGVHFVLTAAGEHRLPATIRSRCGLLRFGPVEEGLLGGFIGDTLGLPSERAAVVARMAEGSLGRAMELAQAEDKAEMDTRVVEVLLGVGQRPSAGKLFELGEELTHLKEDLEPFLDRLRRTLRDLVWWGMNDGGYRGRVLDTELISRLPQGLLQHPPEVFLSWLRVVERAMGALRANANKRLTVEGMLIELAER